MIRKTTLNIGFIAVKRLKTLPATSVSQEEILEILFERIDRKEVDFTFVFDFATKLLTHLGIACTCYDYYLCNGRSASL